MQQEHHATEIGQLLEDARLHLRAVNVRCGDVESLSNGGSEEGFGEAAKELLDQCVNAQVKLEDMSRLASRWALQTDKLRALLSDTAAAVQAVVVLAKRRHTANKDKNNNNGSNNALPALPPLTQQLRLCLRDVLEEARRLRDAANEKEWRGEKPLPAVSNNNNNNNANNNVVNKTVSDDGDSAASSHVAVAARALAVNSARFVLWVREALTEDASEAAFAEQAKRVLTAAKALVEADAAYGGHAITPLVERVKALAATLVRSAQACVLQGQRDAHARCKAAGEEMEDTLMSIRKLCGEQFVQVAKWSAPEPEVATIQGKTTSWDQIDKPGVLYSEKLVQGKEIFPPTPPEVLRREEERRRQLERQQQDSDEAELASLESQMEQEGLYADRWHRDGRDVSEFEARQKEAMMRAQQLKARRGK